VGVRLFEHRGDWDGDFEATVQAGRCRNGSVREWTLAADTGYSLRAMPWWPRLGLKVDVASGDTNPRDRTLSTFDALYLQLPYFTEAGLVAPANLINVSPSIRLQPGPSVTLALI
jgi:hypothetical protein